MRHLAWLALLLPPRALAADVTTIVPSGKGIMDVVSVTSEGTGFAAYLTTAHAVGVAVVAAIAVVMIVWGAVGIFGENVWGKTKGKERVQNAILGLLLAAGSYVILKTISASLTSADFTLDGNLGTEVSGTAITNTGLSTYSSAAGTSGGSTTNQGSNNWPGVEGEWADVNTESELIAWQNQYKNNGSYDQIISEGGTLNADGSYTLTSRVTGYVAGETNSDVNTDAGRSSFGTDLRGYTGSGTYGTAAVDPSVIPYGSVIHTSSGWYVAGDIGGAVVNRTASSQTNPVVDTYGSSDGGTQSVTVYPYVSPNGKSYAQLSSSERSAYINSLTYSR